MAHPILDRTCVCGRTSSPLVIVDQNGTPYAIAPSGAVVVPNYGDHPQTIVNVPATSPIVATQPNPLTDPNEWTLSWGGSQVGGQLVAADGQTVLYEAPAAQNLSINNAQANTPTVIGGVRSTHAGPQGYSPSLALALDSAKPPPSWSIGADEEIEGHVGTTADRPDPTQGRIYYDTDLGEPIFGNGTSWDGIGGGSPGTFTLIYDNHFDTIDGATPSGLGTEWEQYGPGVGNAGFGTRDPSQLNVNPAGRGGLGTLEIVADDNGGAPISGGCKLVGTGSNFAVGPGSRVEITCRRDDDPGSLTSMVGLLWPDTQFWPDHGEINIVETFNNRDTGVPPQFYMHWANPTGTFPGTPGTNQQIQYDYLGFDASDWHVYTLYWSLTNELFLQVDTGPIIGVFAETTVGASSYVFASTQPVVSPPEVKELALQFDYWSATPVAAALTMEIDRVRVWNTV